jgi:hypothetical protein
MEDEIINFTSYLIKEMILLPSNKLNTKTGDQIISFIIEFGKLC